MLRDGQDDHITNAVSHMAADEGVRSFAKTNGSNVSTSFERRLDTVSAKTIDAADLSGSWNIETLSSTADIRKNAFRWLDLERNSINPHAAFQSYVWCESWAATFCENNPDLPQPRIFLISRGDTLVAILPMMVSRHLGAKMLTLFGEPHSQIANALVRAGVDCRDGLRLCVEQAAFLTDSDMVALGPIPADSNLAQALDEQYLSPDPAEAMSLVQWEGANRSEDYVASLTKNRRKDFNQKFNRLSKLGRVEMRRFEVSDEDFKPMVLKALSFKRQWLEKNGIVSVGLSRKNISTFLTRFVPHDAGFMPEVEALFVGGKVVAINIQIAGRGMTHCYLSAYDLQYVEFSPGTLLHQLSIRNCVDDGLIGFNFLGYPTHFKNMWASDRVPLVRYKRAVTFKGKMWLNVWTDTLRPSLKSVFMHARKTSRLPIVGPVAGRLLSKIASAQE